MKLEGIGSFPNHHECSTDPDPFALSGVRTRVQIPTARPLKLLAVVQAYTCCEDLPPGYITTIAVVDAGLGDLEAPLAVVARRGVRFFLFRFMVAVMRRSGPFVRVR